MYRWGECVVTITVCLFTEPAVLVVHDWGRAKNTLTAGTWIICWMGSSFTPKNRCMCSKPTTFTTQKLGRVQGNILWIFKRQCGYDRWAKCWCDKKAELTHLRVSNVEIRTCSHVCRERGPDAWRKQINFRVEKPCPLVHRLAPRCDLSLSYRIYFKEHEIRCNRLYILHKNCSYFQAEWGYDVCPTAFAWDWEQSADWEWRCPSLIHRFNVANFSFRVCFSFPP